MRGNPKTKKIDEERIKQNETNKNNNKQTNKHKQ